jgi:hypothetical protein
MATTTNNGWETPDDTDLVKDGALAMRTLGSAIDTSVGTGLLAWQSWAPTLSGGWLNGNGTWDANYAQIGKNVIVNGVFTIGSTTTKGTTLQISLPVTAKDTVGLVGTAYANSGGSTFLLANLIQSTTTLRLYAINSAATYGTIVGITATVPTTWTTGDVVRLQCVYEAA